MRAQDQSDTFVDLLRTRSIDDPERIAYVFAAEGLRRQTSISYGELDRRARALGRLLQSRQLAGERAVLVFPPGLDCIVAFFGCLYAGVIAIPVTPPGGRRHSGRLLAVVRDARARVGLTTASLCADLAEQTNADSGVHLDWIAADTITDGGEDWRMPDIGPGTAAYLQYTSGSTSEPKGVVITHANILANCAGIARAAGHTRADALVSWLPHVHDMGLVYGILHPLYSGFLGVIVAPAAFLQQPVLWLEAMSRFAAHSSAAPNFAYALCTAKTTPEHRRTLNLHRWRVAVCGAEPIRKLTLEQFSETFQPCGFRWEAFAPAYGMAEATLRITSTAPAFGESAISVSLNFQELQHNRIVDAESGEAAQDIMGCGRPDPGVTVLIVDSETGERCTADEIGEIWVSGPVVGAGYWNRPDATENTFGAHLATGEGPFLRTGDLGFLRDGQLFVTGRLKDLIIVHGRNYYPQDIELIAEASHEALRAGCAAAFSVELDGEERLVIVCEVERSKRKGDLDEVVAAIRRSVIEKLELDPYTVTLASPGAVPKTSSGKVQRRACRQLHLNDELTVLTSWTQSGAGADELIARIWADLLKVERVENEANFFELGGHSLLATQVISRVRALLGVDLPLQALFDAPTVEALAAEIGRRQCEGQGLSLPPIPRADRSRPLPASYAQQRLWFLDRFEPGGSAYNMPYSLRLTGNLDVEALRRTIEEVIRRNEVLRTHFALVDGHPVQVIDEPGAFSLGVTDLTGIVESERDERVREMSLVEADRAFDLSRGPLIRAHLLRLAAQDHVLLFTLHHIVTDGWSMGVLFREVSVLYQTYSTGKPSPLPELEIQYGDYAAWQRSWFAGEVLERQLAYWRERLADLPALELPTDHPRPAVQSYRGDSVPVCLPAELMEALTQLGQREGVTLFMTLLAGFSALLGKYSGQPDIVVGAPIANRTQGQTEDLIGFFVNTLVLRADLAKNPTVREVLGRVRATALGAYAHQDLPFETLVDELHPERDMSRNPLFQVMLVLQNAPLDELTLPGLSLHLTPSERVTARFDLSLNLTPSAAGLTGQFRYAADLFERATVERMLGHLSNILRGMAEGPEKRLADISLLGDAERRQLLVDFNATDTGNPPTKCVHQLFEEQVERTPNAIAVVFADQTLSYRQLNARANQVARYLQTLGVGPEVRVGLCLPRSLEMVIGILGILKAGGAYAPLDPEYPGERLALMAAQSGLAVILTEECLLDRLPIDSARIVCQDRDWKPIAMESTENPDSGVALDNSIYVIHTSGSTGEPKGAGVTHGGFANLLRWFITEFDISARDRCLLISSLSFDLTQKNIYAPLLAGGQLHLLSGRHYDVQGLVECVTEQHITLLNCAPSAFYGLGDALFTGSRSINSLRAVFLGGEPISAARLGSWWEAGNGRLGIVNTYGPTECTDICCYHRLTPGDTTNPPIGKPIDNAHVHVLDAGLNLVPTGVSGELCVGGAGVGNGYVGDPAQTAEKFVPNSYARTPGERIYRTGDLVRRLADGNLEFVGRIDKQVKIRGRRIELGEIEACLVRHPRVRDAAVIAHPDADGDARLAAYVTRHDGPTLTMSEMREFLKNTLPEYMIPSALVTLDRLPLNPNGKIDAAALPAPDFTRAVDREYTPPRTKIEEQLTEIWRDVLKIDRIGVFDRFFEIGGDSLKAAVVANKIQSTFGKIVYVVAIFDAPTVAELAEYLIKNYGISDPGSCTNGHVDSTGPDAEPARVDMSALMQLRQLIGQGKP